MLTLIKICTEKRESSTIPHGMEKERMKKIRIDHSECELNMSSYKNIFFMCETISNGNDDGLPN